ncbi:MAG: N-acetyl-gamma-glutamyl-phosphate reductase [bacterium]|nr:N-acetyl-gamma-glutamyl-phosphate reductase [bacterium]
MSFKVFIDGHAGTTGLRIRDWLRDRDDLELIEIETAQRKSPEARRKFLNAADLVVLCLPDDAAREAVSWIDNPDTRVIDTSTAHRVADGWVYGIPELLPDQREAIRSSKRVSNSGCYALASAITLRPLVDADLLDSSSPIAIHALSGYSGGGRQKIEQWEDPEHGLLTLPYEAPYSLDRLHKHMPEIQKHARLDHSPVFVPAVGPFRCGMRVQIPLHTTQLKPGSGDASVSGKQLWECLDARYRGEIFVKVIPVQEPFASDERALDPRACNDTNRIELRVIPHPAGHVLLVATLDNLGKGAAGAAIQNLNLMLGVAEDEGLPA